MTQRARRMASLETEKAEEQLRVECGIDQLFRDRPEPPGYF